MEKGLGAAGKSCRASAPGCRMILTQPIKCEWRILPHVEKFSLIG